MEFVGVIDPVNVGSRIDFIVIALFGKVFGDFVGEVVE